MQFLPFFAASVLLTLAATCLAAKPLAFPGAEGYGRFVTGGRGGTVIAVTNLDDSGEGSLRAAIETRGPRTIVFRVAGTIYLESNLKVSQGDVTIAGQTAPGEGICIANYGLQVGANNVIIRFLRSRLGDLAEAQADAFGAGGSDGLIIDHCTFSWGVDEVASTYRNRNFTMQWCIISEALHDSLHEKGDHGYGGIWGGVNASFHHNLLAHNRSRNPRFNGARYGYYKTGGDHQVDYRNNVIYNWGGNSAYGAEPNADGFQAQYNLIGNYYKAGPATHRDVTDRIIDVSTRGGHVSRFYVEGNCVVGHPEVTEDNWLGVHNIPEGLMSEARMADPFSAAPITEDAAPEAYAYVLAHAGASFPARDSVDRRIIDEVCDGTATYGRNGHIDSQSEVGGFPALAAGEAPRDRDQDGMPDDWEVAHGLDPDDPEDRNGDPDGDGHTHLEDYLNGLVAHFYQNL